MSMIPTLYFFVELNKIPPSKKKISKMKSGVGLILCEFEQTIKKN